MSEEISSTAATASSSQQSLLSSTSIESIESTQESNSLASTQKSNSLEATQKSNSLESTQRSDSSSSLAVFPASSQSSSQSTQRSVSLEALASGSGEALSLSSEESATSAAALSFLQLDAFNDDILFAVFKRLDIQNRLNCAKVSKRWNKLLKKWIDIQSIGISEKHFSIKNEFIEASMSFKVHDTAKINPMVLMFLKKCSHIYHLVIHNAHVLKYFATIWSKFENLELLVLPNDTFDELKFKDSSTLLHLLSNSKLQSLHILEHIKSFPSKKRIFAPLHVSVMSTKRLQIFHAHGIILGPLAMEKLAEKFANSLQELRISAVCVASSDAERYWKAIAKFNKLKVLELPPSLFSIGRQMDTKNLSLLTNIKSLESLSVYICPQVTTEVGLFLSYIPKTLQKLFVRTYSSELPDTVIAALHHQKVKLIFLPKKSYSFRWPFTHSDGHYQLFLKGFWEPPYFPETELIGVNLTPEIIRAQTSNWQCNLPDLAKIEAESMLVDVVETAQDRATDNLVTASASETGVATGRVLSPIVEHPPNDNGHANEPVNGMANQPHAGPPQGQQTPPAVLHIVPSTHSPLNPPTTSPLSTTNISPASTQELPAASSAAIPPPVAPASSWAVNDSAIQGQPQDGNSSYSLSPLTATTPTATSGSGENIPSGSGELLVDVAQRSDASPSQSAASISNTSTASATTTSTTSASTTSQQTTASGSSIGTGWFV